jgi:hypothetical protein
MANKDLNKFTDSHNRFNTQRAYGMNPGSARNGAPTDGTKHGMDTVSNTETADATNGLLQASTNILIKAFGETIGLILSFSMSENRNINKLQAVGFEGVVQAVPSNTNGGQLSVTRIAMYNTKLADIFGINEVNSAYKNGSGEHHTTPYFVTLRNQRVPFEIQVHTPTNNGVGKSATWQIDTYVDCWLSSWSKSYSVQQIYVTENATIQYGDVR